MSEWASERANERMSAAERANEISSAEQTNEVEVQANRGANNPVLHALIS